MKSIKGKSFIWLIYLIVSSQVFSQHTGETNSKEYSNRFFILDLESDTCDTRSFENRFFTTYPHNDPTRGDVVYDRVKWENKDLFRMEKGTGLFAYIKARTDYLGFDSFRFTSKSYFNIKENAEKILFVYKGKMPSEKGMWPAWWLNGSREKEWTYTGVEEKLTDSILDPYSGKGEFYNTSSPVNSTDWPSSGEIDMIETINGDNIIHNTLHTCPGMCDSEWNGDGQVINCANATRVDPNSGCSGRTYKLPDVEGVFAMVWEEGKLRFYYWGPDENFRNESGPLGIKPDPEQWDRTNLKNSVRLFDADCECEDELHHEWQCNVCDGRERCGFTNMKMIFNITLCGIWAGAHFDETETSLKNCQEYVRGEGKKIIDNQFIRIDYVAVRNLSEIK